MIKEAIERRVFKCWEGSGRPWEYGVLALGSALYSLGVKFRREIYELGLKGRYRLPVPVVSVGNIALGGTGKTPLVAWLARRFLEEGVRVAVVSRGYGRMDEDKVRVVADGERVYLGAFEGGDEPLLLARKISGLSVVVGRSRFLASELACRKLGAQLILLDDGFQYLAIHRDVDVLLFDGERGLGKGKVFPSGILREPLESIRKAHILAVTKGENRELASQLQMVAPHLPLFTLPLEVTAVRTTEGEELPIGLLKDRRVFAFCGIANPPSFFSLLKMVGVKVQVTRAYPDHHRYSQREIEGLAQELEGIDVAVTTEKDWVNMEGLHIPFPLWVISVELSPPREFWVELKRGLRI